MNAKPPSKKQSFPQKLTEDSAEWTAHEHELNEKEQFEKMFREDCGTMKEIGNIKHLKEVNRRFASSVTSIITEKWFFQVNLFKVAKNDKFA